MSSDYQSFQFSLLKKVPSTKKDKEKENHISRIVK